MYTYKLRASQPRMHDAMGERQRKRSMRSDKSIRMESLNVRRILVHVEQTLHEGGPVAAQPQHRGFACAVIENPFAGEYVEEIQPFMETLSPLGVELATRLVDALSRPPDIGIEAFGKGAIVGSAGEIEHGALWHVPGGYAMREILGDARAIVPSTKKVGPVGARLDVPLTHINASYVRSHFDAIEAGVPGAPAANEIVVILAMASGPRIHARVGGLAANEIRGEDGLR